MRFFKLLTVLIFIYFNSSVMAQNHSQQYHGADVPDGYARIADGNKAKHDDSEVGYIVLVIGLATIVGGYIWFESP